MYEVNFIGAVNFSITPSEFIVSDKSKINSKNTLFPLLPSLLSTSVFPKKRNISIIVNKRMKPSYITVVGGANIDIAGTPQRKLIAADSNPGRVRVSFGGVGRNIAENLVRLGTQVKLITAFGDDLQAESMKNFCIQTGIDISDSNMPAGRSGSTYLFITDERGEMQLAIADMGIFDTISPEFLQSKLPHINQSALCVADTNIPEESLHFLFRHCTVPLFVDTVSVTKAEKIKAGLRSIHTIKPNKLEAEFLTGIPIADDEDLHRVADNLLQKGVRQVFISLGMRGLFCADKTEKVLIPPKQVQAVSTTGAGDSAMAGLAWAFLHGLGLKESGEAATACASICVESEKTVSEAMSLSLLRRRANIDTL
ncbi:kinase, PfkB family [Treponema phagedenis F0421]|nr:kinase, PfkB family [Treponema phagedenis F0421]TYT79482.1 MarR family transcriptional regulator [Treponema phagedenis]